MPSSSRLARLDWRRCAAVLAIGAILAAPLPAGAEDARTPAGVAVATASMHGVATLRGRGLLAAYPGTAWLPAQASDEPAAAEPGMPDVVRGAIGCVVAGTFATVIALGAGGENTINLVAGGLVPSVNRAALYVGLVGVVFGSFCAIGQALTPIVTHEVVPPPAPAPAGTAPSVGVRHAAADPTIPQRLAFQAGVLGAAVATATHRIGATALANVPPPHSSPGATPPVLVAQQQ